MSDRSLRHVVHKRVHLERPQPTKRHKLGYLEKHKDYVKRAKDFHRKEDTIKKLQRKAYFKNEDEFAFAMKSNFTKGGKMKANVKDSHLQLDELRLADSQDVKYINMREQIDKKAARKRGENLHFLDAERPNKHTIFVDEDDGAPSSRGLKTFDVAAHFDTHPALLSRKANRLTKQQLETQTFADSDELDLEKRQAYRELLHRQERAQKLGRVREDLERRQHLRGKGRRMKVKDADKEKDRPAQNKWFPERKK